MKKTAVPGAAAPDVVVRRQSGPPVTGTAPAAATTAHTPGSATTGGPHTARPAEPDPEREPGRWHRSWAVGCRDHPHLYDAGLALAISSCSRRAD